MRLVLGCLLILLPYTTFAQSDSLYQFAKTAFEAREFDKAYTTYQEAGIQYEQENNWAQFLRCRVEMARCSQFTTVVSRAAIKDILDPAMAYIREDSAIRNTPEAAECFQFYARYFWSVQGDYPTAIDAYEQSLAICEELGDTANYYKMASMADLSHVYSNQEQFDKALRYANGSLQLSKEIYGEDHVENGPRYYTLGFTYYRKGHYERAVTEIQKGIEILQAQEGPEMQIGLGYNNLSAVYVAMLDPEGALQSSNAAMQILSKYLGPDHEAIGTIEWDLGVMYADLQDYQLAATHYLRAKEIFEKNFGPSYPQLPQLYHQYGECLDHLREYSEAGKWHLKAKEINLKSHGPLHPRTGDSYRNMADHNVMAGQLKLAEDELERGFKVLSKHKGDSDLLKAWLYQSKGSLLSGKKEYLASASAYEMAARAVCNMNASNLDPSIDLTYSPLFYTEAFIEKSKALRLLYVKSQDLNHLSQALDAARKADQGIRKLRSSYHSPEAKLFLQLRARPHYDLMMQILYDLWVTKKDESLLEEAWKVSEQTKSLLLFEQVMAGDLMAFTMPTAAYDSLSGMQQDLNFLRGKIDAYLESGDSTNAANSQRSYFALSTGLQLFQKQLAEKYPKFASLQSDLTPITARKVGADLETSQALIEYYLTGDAIFSFWVSAEDFQWVRRETSAPFRSLLADYNQDVRNLDKIISDPSKAIQDHRVAGAALYRYLFPQELGSVISTIDQLVIVPDQDLGYISFEALCEDAATDQYLIDVLSISYAYSASLFELNKKDAKDLTFAKFAGFAPTYKTLDTTDYATIGDGYAQLSRAGQLDLPGAQQEVGEINKIMKGTVWINESATVDNFKTNASDFTIIHLALHGLVDEKNPMKSELLFHSDAGQPGELRASEIYDLSLNANLAVLSACNTATGSINAGEGILSLSRAFAFAGVPNLVASLWRADDHASSEIMISFYEQMAQGKTKDQALRLAKLDYLKSQKAETYRHPYFWSSYIYVGENKASFITPTSNRWWIFPGLTVLIILVIVYLSKRNSETK